MRPNNYIYFQVGGYHIGFEFTNDGKKIYSGDSNGCLYVYDTNSTTLRQKIDVHHSIPCVKVACNQYDTSLVVCGAWDGRITLLGWTKCSPWKRYTIDDSVSLIYIRPMLSDALFRSSVLKIIRPVPDLAQNIFNTRGVTVPATLNLAKLNIDSIVILVTALALCGSKFELALH